MKSWIAVNPKIWILENSCHPFVVICGRNWASLIAQLVKNLPAMQKTPVHGSWVRKICWRRDRLPTPGFLGFPCVSAGKESGCNAGDLGSIPGLGRSPGEGKGVYHATQAICLGVILTLPFSTHHFQSLSKPYLPFLLCILLITCCHINAVLFKTD